MDSQGVYEGMPQRDAFGSGKQSQDQTEAQNNKRSRCLEPITLCLGIFCALLVAAIIVMYIHFTAERDMMEMRYVNMKENSYETQQTYESLRRENQNLKTRVEHLSDARMKTISGTSRYFISCEFKNWIDSRQFCRDRGANLVIINTEEEQRYVSSMITDSIWIGLSDIENEGVMQWVDNSSVDVEFWVSGEPNDASGVEDCVHIGHSSPPEQNWNDQRCTEKRRWICEN
ncbi:C-type lectin domain family 6 member A-like [Triplophysa dalaica]|uniref:C-type lectin domain family 6 member A-like n=1 Tax=Triplophysa dalaica TaxID=1582913 RepID=UPI0024DFA0D8|nr:C-type lectin domain family 6 member A-like [Triplophysa dalaica]